MVLNLTIFIVLYVVFDFNLFHCIWFYCTYKTEFDCIVWCVPSDNRIFLWSEPVPVHLTVNNCIRHYSTVYWYILLCFALFDCILLFSTYSILFECKYILLYSTIFYCILHYTIFDGIIRYSNVLFYIRLYFTIFDCILQCSTVYYHIQLCLLYSTVFY